MTRQKSYTTAAARRRANPIEFVIDDHIIRLKPSADLTEIADIIDEVTRVPDDNSSIVRSAIERKSKMIEMVKSFILPSSHQDFDDLSVDLDPMILQQMLLDLIMEYTGQVDPTQAPSSSDGSSETGNSSMDGAQPEA